MGHRHTPEKLGGARAVCGADGGFAAVAKGHVGAHFNAPFVATEDAGEKGGSRSALTPIEQRSIPARAALFALRFYKAYLSILFAGSCRFEPTCSRYAYEAIERFGVARGIWLGTKRLLRCQPLSRKFGYDPVPEKWENMSSEINAGATSSSRAAATQNEVHS
jgi:putative membrane protein insertion efficiency factor